jgi:glucarate dehydratase
MPLNLSGAHGSYFTRNIVIIYDSSGNKGIAEVLSGVKIKNTLDSAEEYVLGTNIGAYKNTLKLVQKNLIIHTMLEVHKHLT